MEGTNFGNRSYFARIERHGKLVHFWLHKQVWIDNNGTIPDGMVLHHIDGNPGNNEITNLQLTTSSNHSKVHNNNEFKSQDKARKWHKSEEGMEFHRQHGKEWL